MYAIILHGIAGSYKTTLVNHLKNINPLLKIVSKDTYRIFDGEYKFESSTEPIVEKKFFEYLENLINKNKNIIVDNTHLNKIFRKKVINFILQHNSNYIIKIISIIPDTIEEHIKSNIHNLTETNIINQMNIFKIPKNAIVISRNDIKNHEFVKKLYDHLFN
jgi:tRNA uridine 5-carbamoylmethylation protein Kti12